MGRCRPGRPAVDSRGDGRGLRSAPARVPHRVPGGRGVHRTRRRRRATGVEHRGHAGRCRVRVGDLLPGRSGRPARPRPRLAHQAWPPVARSCGTQAAAVSVRGRVRGDLDPGPVQQGDHRYPERSGDPHPHRLGRATPFHVHHLRPAHDRRRATSHLRLPRSHRPAAPGPTRVERGGDRQRGTRRGLGSRAHDRRPVLHRHQLPARVNGVPDRSRLYPKG